MTKKQPTFSLKDQLFNKKKVEYISGLILKIYPDFLSEDFKKEVLKKFPELELKQRIYHITKCLKKYLPDDFEKGVKILLKSLPELEENGTLDNNFGDFIFAPYSGFVSEYGCEEKYLDFSLNSLEKFTSYFSAEFAIRKFFNQFEKETFEKMLEFSKSKNYHHRRFASEGSRPKLPWAEKINLDYKKTIGILDNLYFDESRFVTRSVANHLNDISKIDPELVIETLLKWKNEDKDKKEFEYLVNHSTRNLVKSGDKKTLEFLGYSSNPKIEIKNFKIKKNKIKIGENLEFNFNIFLTKEEKLIVDYKIYFPLKNGKLSEKVFKIKKGNFAKKVSIFKKHLFKIMTTKSLFFGEYYLELFINGNSSGKKKFDLIK